MSPNRPVHRGLTLIVLYAIAQLDHHFNSPSRVDKVAMLLGWVLLLCVLLTVGLWILVTFGPIGTGG